jgi:hypothetical protein
MLGRSDGVLYVSFIAAFLQFLYVPTPFRLIFPVPLHHPPRSFTAEGPSSLYPRAIDQ